MESIIVNFDILPIIFLVETWLRKDEVITFLPFVNLYTVYRSDREKGHGGVAIFVPKTLPSTVIAKGIVCKEFESIWCRLILSKKNIDLGVIYRPPRRHSEVMPRKMNEHIQNSLKGSNPTIIFGDFNYGDIDWQNNTSPNQNGQNIFLNFMNDVGFSQLIDFPTRNLKILDLLFINEPNLVQSVDIGPKISDHETVTAVVTIQVKANEKVKFRDFKNADFTTIAKDLVSVNWEKIFCHKSTNEMWISFVEIISHCLSKHIPLRTVNNSFSMSSKVKKLCRKAWKLHKVWKNKKTPQAYAKYIEVSKIAQREKRQSTFSNELKVLNSKNPQSFWKFVRKKMTYKNAIPCLRNSRNEVISDSQDKANLLNEYFCSVFTKDDNTLHQWNIDYDAEILEETPNVTSSMVNHKLRKLSPKVSFGPDGIPSVVFKKLAHVLDLPLSIIFQSSLRHGSVPEQWKEAKITALLKKGNPCEPSNYRPVSLTCVACRILESIIADHLNLHLDEMIFEGQHGFVRKKSTVTQLFETIESYVDFLDDNKLVDVVLVDFKKAFDSVCHNKLLSKLECYGIKGNLLAWIRNFLQDRTQRVCIDGFLSDKGEVLSGVPQGSVLGPLLFLIFINDLHKYADLQCVVKLFADDCKILFGFKPNSQNEDLNSLQKSLNAMAKWAEYSQMQIQPSKCGVMYLGRNNQKRNYYFGDELIPEVNEVRDLGVIFDHKLSFEAHINTVVKSASQTANMILRNFRNRKPSFMVQMFNTFVRCKLEYASPIWNPHLKFLIDRIEAVQRRYTKRLPALKNVNYKNRLLFLNISSLELRRLHLDLMFLYKLIHGHLNVKVDDYFEFKNTQTRGHSRALIKKPFKKDIKKYSFAQRIINAWNFLPETIINAPSVATFKKRLWTVNLSRFLKGEGLDV